MARRAYSGGRGTTEGGYKGLWHFLSDGAFDGNITKYTHISYLCSLPLTVLCVRKLPPSTPYSDTHRELETCNQENPNPKLPHVDMSDIARLGHPPSEIRHHIIGTFPVPSGGQSSSSANLGT